MSVLTRPEAPWSVFGDAWTHQDASDLDGCHELPVGETTSRQADKHARQSADRMTVELRKVKDLGSAAKVSQTHHSGLSNLPPESLGDLGQVLGQGL